MSTPTLLRSLFAYKRWADDELLERMRGLDPDTHAEARRSAIRLVNHFHIVDRIFAAHLSGEAHAYAGSNTPETPALDELHAAVAASDRWFLDYLDAVPPPQLAEFVPFVFTDGDRGRMSREEMLMHVITHGGYHRGEVGRILERLAIGAPRDTFAVFLHRTEPARRLGTD